MKRAQKPGLARAGRAASATRRWALAGSEPSGRGASATVPSALAIAGLDPSGGAGLAMDLRAFAASGVWGAAVCAAITVQSTRGVRAVHPVDPALVAAQAREVLGDLHVRAIKTGALGSAACAREIAAILRQHPGIIGVVDPVMLPSRRIGRGEPLFDPTPMRREPGGRKRSLGEGGDAREAMRELAAAAALVTPNLAEAAFLVGAPLATEADARDAAVALVRAGARAVLVKGGHLRGPEAVDWLATRSGVVRLARARIDGATEIHGTGCALASLVAGRLAGQAPRRGALDDDALLASVRWARARLTRAMRSALATGRGARVLGPFARPPPKGPGPIGG